MGFGDTPLTKRGWASKRDACQEYSTASESVDSQMRCLHRVIDTRAKGFVITKPMIAKSDRHKSKPSAVVMTKAVLA